MAKRNLLIVPVKSANAPATPHFRAKNSSTTARAKDHVDLAVKAQVRRKERFQMKPVKHSLAHARS